MQIIIDSNFFIETYKMQISSVCIVILASVRTVQEVNKKVEIPHIAEDVLSDENFGIFL